MRPLVWAMGLGLMLWQGQVAAAGLKDPMRPPARRDAPAVASVAQGAKAWRLTMTRISGRDRVAVVNDKLVAVGERVDGARVLAITPSSVDLEQAGRRFRVKLSVPAVKRISNGRRKGW